MIRSIVRKKVVSSNLDEIGYDEPTKTLEVLFKNGTVYQYVGVPKHVYEGLESAGSVGSYFHAQVKNTFTFTRVQ